MGSNVVELPDYLKKPSFAGHLFGDLSFVPGTGFVVQNGEPVAMDFLKRLFPGGSFNRTKNTITFGNSHREVKDLNWFLMKYPLRIIGDGYPEALNEAIAHYRSRTSGKDLLPANPPPVFKGQLYPFQATAANFLVSNKRCLLGDGMGLGKTFSALGAVAVTNQYPVLVVCQTQVLDQWQRVIGALFDLPCAYQAGIFDSPYDIATKRGAQLAPILKGRKPYEIPDTPFAVIHYGLIADWEDEIKRRGFRSVIYDEVQELRRTESNKYSSASKVSSNCEHVWGLSVGPDSIVELRGWIFKDGFVDTIERAMLLVENHMGLSRQSSIDIEGKGVESRGWISSDVGFGWKPVKKFFRHKNTSPTREIRVGANPIIVTDDHSVFRAREALGTPVIECVKSKELTIGDVIPVDNGNYWEGADESAIDVVELLRDVERAQVSVDLSGIDRKDIGTSPQQWFKYKHSSVYGSRLPVSVYLKNRSRLPAARGVYLAPSKHPMVCDPEIKASDWAYILGSYIGNGWIDGERVGFSIKNEFVECFIAELTKLKSIETSISVSRRPRGSDEVRVSGRIFSILIEHMVHGKKPSYEKTIPGEWIVSWPREARMELLRGLIDTDGHVSKSHGRIYYCTTSEMLTRQLMSLLRSLGLSGGISKRKICDGGVINGEVVRGLRPSYIVNWSGYETKGDVSGYRGQRRTYKWSTGLFNERRLRSSVECEAPEFVYDLEMDLHPSFTASGCLVHNSGTPIFGYGPEIWSVTNAIDMNCLGAESSFKREWCDPNDSRIIKDPRALNDYLTKEGLLLRRRATDPDVGIDLPKIVRNVQDVDQDDTLYEQLIAETRAMAARWEGAHNLERGRISQDVERNARRAAGIAKAPFVADAIASLLEVGEVPLVYAWHHDVHDVIAERLKTYGPSVINGRVSKRDKDKALKRFIDGRSNVAMMSLRSAAGLDGLQSRATCTVFAELDWCPPVMWQCETRIARIGVPDEIKEVPSHYCVSRSGFDEVMLDALGIKKGQFTGLMADEPETAEEQREQEERVASRMRRLIDRIANGGKKNVE